MKILIIDDHALFREGLRLLLGRLGENLEIFEADTVAAGMALCQRLPDMDMILLDLNLPGINGMEGLGRFRLYCPSGAVILLSGSDEGGIAAEARSKGAQGFIPKTISAEDLLHALRCVMNGAPWFPATTPSAAAVQLTERQREVLACLCQGFSNKEIGRELGMSENTVRTHVAVIFRVMAVNSRTGAALAARRYGFF
jgi:DNA-binding NarL/FixJ family response regulator